MTQEEASIRACLKVGIGFGIPALILLIIYFEYTWPYMLGIGLMVLWVISVDRMIDAIRQRRNNISNCRHSGMISKIQEINGQLIHVQDYCADCGWKSPVFAAPGDAARFTEMK